LKYKFKNKSKDSSEKQTNHTSSNGGGWSLLTALSATVNTTDWYIDSGALNHMSMGKDWFENYRAVDAEQVTCAGNQKLHTARISDIRANGNNGLRNITGVKHVPNLSANLLSVSAIAKRA
jgi:hypothetical protein